MDFTSYFSVATTQRNGVFTFGQKNPELLLACLPISIIHTHDRQVDSRVLQGQLTNILYDVNTVSVGGHPLYQVSYHGDRYAAMTTNILRNTHRRAQTLIRSYHTIKCGDTYQIERHCYHESVVSQQLATSTIVCMHERSPGAIMVVGLDGYPETITFTRTEQCARTLAEQISL